MPLNKLSLDKDAIGPPPGVGGGGGGGGSSSQYDIDVEHYQGSTDTNTVHVFKGEQYQKIDVKSVVSSSIGGSDTKIPPVKIKCVGVVTEAGDVLFASNPDQNTVIVQSEYPDGAVQETEDVGVVQVPPVPVPPERTASSFVYIIEVGYQLAA
jgi:hypothetical protein